MESFDDSGDGALQIEEFVTLEKFRNTLEALAREEKQIALEEAKLAKIEEEKTDAPFSECIDCSRGLRRGGCAEIDLLLPERAGVYGFRSRS